jgi:hypothetical protein
MLKSYNVFVDSSRGTTLNIHEQAPSGGVVRVSLKSLTIPRTFSNISSAKRRFINIGVAPAGAVITLAFIASLSEETLPVAIYTTKRQIIDAMVAIVRRVMQAYDAAALVEYVDGVVQITSNMGANGDRLYILTTSAGDSSDGLSHVLGIPTSNRVEAETTFALSPDTVDLTQVAQAVYLRIDSPTNNLESRELAGVEDDSPYDELRHSDILGSVQLTRGEGAFNWRAFIPNERSFEVGGSLQSLQLRLTDHRNVPLEEFAESDVPFQCVIGVEVLIKHNIRTLGYGPVIPPVDAKSSRIYVP